MCYKSITIILLAIALLICTVIYSVNKNKLNKVNIKENWESYQQTPLNYIKSGSSPLGFYRRDRYRKPYRYPLKHYESSPYPNMSYWN